MNPFYCNTSSTELVDITIKELFVKFKDIKLLCLKNNGKHSDKIFNKDIDNFDEILVNYTLIPISLQFYNKYINKCIIIPGQFLANFFDGKFLEKELVLPIFFKRECNFNEYLKLSDGLCNITTVLDTMQTHIYLDQKKLTFRESERLYFCNLLRNINEGFYWAKKYNCRQNITGRFINRRFKINESTTLIENKIKEIIDNKKDDDNYLNFLYKKREFVDISMCGSNYYKISNHPILETLTNDKVMDIIDMFLDQKYFKEIIEFIFTLLKSKDLCHLIINNYEVMNFINTSNIFNGKTFMEKYFALFHHILRYVWVTFYNEECIKKRKITKNDRFIFNLKNASVLPCFAYNPSCPETNPYLPILVNSKVLDATNNFKGIISITTISITTYALGVHDLNTFKTRLNMFMTDNDTINILEGLEWATYNFAINGSAMCACAIKNNPIELRYTNFKTYLDNIYNDSDVDLMSLTRSFKFIDALDNIKNTIQMNNIKYYDEVFPIFTTCSKVICVSFDHDYAKNNLVDDEITFEELLKDCNTLKIKEKIYKQYVDYKMKWNEKQMSSDYWANSKYDDEFMIAPFNNLKIILYPKDKTIRFNENLKYKITCTTLKRPIEFFSITGQDPFSSVSQFHLPCVRAYYDGVDVYCTPSFISSAMTFMNIDYKYFSGTNHPCEIMLKYNQRGMGIFLNDYEKNILIKYIADTKRWQKKLNVSTDPIQIINKIFATNNSAVQSPSKWTDIINNQFKQSINSRHDETTKLLNMLAIDNNGFIKPMNNEIINYFISIL